jgi:hypothetical protein
MAGFIPSSPFLLVGTLNQPPLAQNDLWARGFLLVGAAVWLRLQTYYDLEIAEMAFGERIKEEVQVLDRGGLPTAV